MRINEIMSDRPMILDIIEQQISLGKKIHYGSWLIISTLDPATMNARYGLRMRNKRTGTTIISNKYSIEELDARAELRPRADGDLDFAMRRRTHESMDDEHAKFEVDVLKHALANGRQIELSCEDGHGIITKIEDARFKVFKKMSKSSNRKEFSHTEPGIRLHFRPPERAGAFMSIKYSDMHKWQLDTSTEPWRFVDEEW